MSTTSVFAKVCNGPALHDALQAAKVSVERVETTPTETRVVFTNAADTAAVAAAVAAHNPALLSVGEQRTAQEGGSLSDLASTYQNLLAGLGTISGHMDQITAGPAAPTAAQTGTALKTLAGDMKSMTVGLTKLLNVVAILVQRGQSRSGGPP